MILALLSTPFVVGNHPHSMLLVNKNKRDVCHIPITVSNNYTAHNLLEKLHLAYNTYQCEPNTIYYSLIDDTFCPEQEITTALASLMASTHITGIVGVIKLTDKQLEKWKNNSYSLDGFINAIATNPNLMDWALDSTAGELH